MTLEIKSKANSAEDVLPDMEYSSSNSIIEMFKSFKDDWDSMAPSAAGVLAPTEGSAKFPEGDIWISSADVFLLPFHSFETGNEFSFRFTRKISDQTLYCHWEALYFSMETGSDESYAADLLINKRQIFNYGRSLKKTIEINTQASLSKLDFDSSQIEEFDQVFETNYSIMSVLTIDKRSRANDLPVKGLHSLGKSIRRFEGRSGERRRTGNVLRVELTDYWLRWAEVAHRSEFDFDYLSGLTPREMRFYELAQLLRFKNDSKSLKELKTQPLRIKYSEFTKLMPLPRLKSLMEVEAQIKGLCKAHQQRGYIATYSIKLINRKGVFADAELVFEF